LQALKAITKPEVSLRVRGISQRIKTLSTLACLLVLAALPASAVTGTLYTGGLSTPVGVLWLGAAGSAGHVWIADAGGFCRLDPDGKGGASRTGNCAPALPGAVSGQPDWDASTNNVYIPTAAGIARYKFDPAKEQLTGPTANLGQPSQSGLAFGPDKKL